MPIILEGIRKSFGSTPVLSIDHLEIPDSAQWVVTGRSGSGKTTFLNLIAGILLPDAGKVTVAGTIVTRLSEARRDLFRAKKIGFVFQTFNLLSGYSALENVLLGMLFAGRTDRAKAESLLERVGLSDRMGHHPGQMSVGQQQRVAIARALANDPGLILADEPTGNLDPKTGAVVLELLKEICAAGKTTLVAVTHQPQVVDAFPKVWNLSES